MKTIKMKDSGIEWIGEIPEDWGVVKAKYILKSNDGGVWGRDPTGTEKDKTVIRSTEQTIDGTWCIVNPAKRNLSGISFEKSLIRENDLLLTKSSGSSLHIGKTTLADAYFEEHECYYSNFLQRLSLKRTVFPKLYWYIFNSIFVREQFVYLQNSTSGIGNINSDNINNVIVPTLPYDMQQKMVAILDVKCAEIDKLIANQQEQIDKLKEYKQSVITEAVTKGLDPTVPMKDSGVEWIGQIPQKWQLCRVKNLPDYTLLDSFADGDWIESPDIESEGIRYLTTGNVGDGVFKRQGNGYISVETFKRLNCKYAYPNDLVISRLNAPYGRSCILPFDEEKYVLAVDIVILRTQNDKRFICYFTQCREYQHSVEDFARGTAMKRISRSNLGSIKILLPPIETQQQIADYLDDKCGKIDQLIAIKQQKIDKLQQYKKSLIYEYVTGKKEII